MLMKVIFTHRTHSMKQKGEFEMAQTIKTTQRWILEILKMFGAIRVEQAEKLLKMKFPTATLERTIMPLLTSRLIKRNEGYLFSGSGKIDDKTVEAVDIMLLTEPDISQGFICGKGEPIVLTFFKWRNDKLWHYDICPIAYGTEAAVSAKLENTNQKYRMIVFVPEREEQMEAIDISCEHCYVLKNNGNYDFYRYKEED